MAQPRDSGDDMPARSELRVSDAERERVAERIRAAAVEGRLELPELDDRLSAVYAARTYGQLGAVTADLPDDSTADQVRVPTRPVAGGAMLPSHGSEPSRGTAVAVFSGTNRGGRWTVPEQLLAVAVMGGVELDLRNADFAAREVVITAFAMCGGIDITVGENVTVRTEGVGIMGGFDAHGAGEAGPDAPVVVVRGAAIFGAVDVKRRDRDGRRLDRRKRRWDGLGPSQDEPEPGRDQLGPGRDQVGGAGERPG